MNLKMELKWCCMLDNEAEDNSNRMRIVNKERSPNINNEYFCKSQNGETS